MIDRIEMTGPTGRYRSAPIGGRRSVSTGGCRAAMAAVALVAAAFLPVPTATVHAQGVEAGAELRDAVRRLAADPKNVDALLEAGDAALAMDDADAAAGFYLRADAAAPQDGRVKAALGRARLRQEDPVAAIALFDQAVSLGQPEASFAADRGLAYDLVGDTRSAQQAYELARRTDSSDTLTLRLAVSYDLSGKRGEAAKLLNPLLRANDSGAWRAQAFLNAAHGELDRARAAARSFLGAERAGQLDRYLTRMDDLSLAQQMAAIHFGHFPRSNLGVDPPGIAAMQRQAGASSPPVAAKGGGKARDPSFIDFRGSKQKGVSYTPNAVAPPAPQPSFAASPRSGDPAAALAEAGRNAAAPPAAMQPVAASQPAPVAPGFAAPPTAAASVPSASGLAQSTTSSSASSVPGFAAPPATAASAPSAPGFAQASTPSAPAASASAAPGFGTLPVAAASTSQPAGPGFSTQAVATPPAPAPSPAFAPAPAAMAVPATAPEHEPPRDLAALVSDIAIPESERRQDVVPVTAAMVELAENPSRNWVQIATGADLNALGYDYRKFGRQNEALFEGKKGWTAEWGATRRLLVGPFDSLTAAKEWNQAFREAGGDSFIWQSDDGTVVDPLTAR